MVREALTLWRSVRNIRRPRARPGKGGRQSNAVHGKTADNCQAAYRYQAPDSQTSNGCETATTRQA
jgi:hypothetical protein